MKKSQPFSMAHTDDTKQEDELNPDEIQEKLIKRHEVVLLSMEVPHKISLHEGHEGLNFDWSFGFKDYLAGRKYEAKITGTIEARIDLKRVKVEVEKLQKSVPVLAQLIDKINVNVSIPAGYFITSFDFTNLNELKNTAGLFNQTRKKSPASIGGGSSQEYKVNVMFSSGTWYIFKEIRHGKPIGKIIDQ